MIPLLALALATAPGCGAALSDAARLSPEALAERAPALVERLAGDGAGGPATALERAAGALAHPPAGTLDAQARIFRAALARHCALAAAPPVAGATARERAELAEILARPELARPRVDPYALRRALLAIRDWILDLLGTAEAERYASLGRALFLAVAVGAGLLAMAALRRRARRGTPASARIAAGMDAAATALDASAARAEEALRRGDAREAVRHAFLAALGALERDGGLPRGRTLTNGEIVAAFRATPTSTLQDDLPALAAAFDRAVYGGISASVEDARAALERARRVAAGWRA